MLYVGLVMTVPFGRGLVTCTTSWTDEDEPAFSDPMFQVTTPAASVPPPVAETNVVFAGTVSVMTTPLALALPVGGAHGGTPVTDQARMGSAACDFEIARTGAEETVGGGIPPATGAVSCE